MAAATSTVKPFLFLSSIYIVCMVLIQCICNCDKLFLCIWWPFGCSLETVLQRTQGSWLSSTKNRNSSFHHLFSWILCNKWPPRSIADILSYQPDFCQTLYCYPWPINLEILSSNTSVQFLLYSSWRRMIHSTISLRKNRSAMGIIYKT